MFKALKYLFIMTLFKKAKRSFVSLMIYISLIVIVNLIFNDLISISTETAVYNILFIKWVTNILLLALIILSLLNIFHVATNPLQTKISEKKEDLKKKKILGKEKLYTRSEQILQKYKRD